MAEGEIATGRSKVDKLISLLANQEKLGLATQQTLGNLEIAEALWLALCIEPTPSAMPSEPIVQRSTSNPELPNIPSFDSASEELPDRSPRPPQAELSASPPEVGVLPTKALPVWIADPSLLKDPLAVIRALKPLLLQVEAGNSSRLDERATVDGIARTQLWLPVMEAETEPWFDILLVVDGSASMQLWQRLADDLAQILRRYGAFRDLQVFELGVTGEGAGATVQLSTHPNRPSHQPTELIDKQGRRIAIILSDCTATYWWDGALLPMLSEWAAVMPTVVWQVLPAWMWGRTALSRGTAVALNNGTPGAINRRMEAIPSGIEGLSEEAQRRAKLPVITSEPDDLFNWSLMLSGDRRELTPGYLLPQSGGSVPKTKSLQEMAREQLSADQKDDSGALAVQISRIAQARIERFLQLSSPAAQRLVMLLAAAPVITLPVMRLIRDATMGSGRLDERSPLPVAEVFLSGLLQKLPEQAIAPGEVEGQATANLVQYDFVPQVREQLLEMLPAVDTVAVVNSVSAAVEQRWYEFTDRSFQAFLRNPDLEAPAGLAGVRSFASVTADILASLDGEEYLDFVEELREGARGRDADLPAVQSEPDFELPEDLKILEFYRAEVREVAAPVQLVMDEFAIATVEVEQDWRDALVEFEFEVAHVVRQRSASKVGAAGRTAWSVQRERRAAYQFIERLGEDIQLEMVEIPAGTFMMGLPESEPQRDGDESPQHEVSLATYFMAKYPITQAQWRSVAGLMQVNRELKLDPSRFKGNERPVEQVSWYEAVEFCDRLSRHTGNDYRLPTEAQWEYACRAGTTTPFHFGGTILPELANYNCSVAYAGGAEETSKGETTPTGEFGVANAFGLYDMHGNVWEWCADHWHDNYEGAPTDGSAWLTNDEEENRILRGGSWDGDPRYCRSATRFSNAPVNRLIKVGFRISCLAPRTLQLPAS